MADKLMKNQDTKMQTQPFSWLMTQEQSMVITSGDETQTQSKNVRQKKFTIRPFTQVDFPTFTQLLAEEDSITNKIIDPYKPPAKLATALELKEVAWKHILLLPDKEEIINNLVPVLEQTEVRMWNGDFEIQLKAPLNSQPFKKTFLAHCPLITDDDSSSSESSSSAWSSESYNTVSEMSVDMEEHPILLQEFKSTEEVPKQQMDISNDLEISSSEDEGDKSRPEILTAVSVAEKSLSPELPLESLTQKRCGLDMPNIDNKATVATQTDLTMRDIENMMRRKATKESQVNTASVNNEEQRVKRKKKSTVRIGLPRTKRMRKSSNITSAN